MKKSSKNLLVVHVAVFFFALHASAGDVTYGRIDPGTSPFKNDSKPKVGDVSDSQQEYLEQLRQNASLYDKKTLPSSRPGGTNAATAPEQGGTQQQTAVSQESTAQPVSQPNSQVSNTAPTSDASLPDAPKTRIDDGIEYDIESGVSTGRVVDSSGGSHNLTPPEPRAAPEGQATSVAEPQAANASASEVAAGPSDGVGATADGTATAAKIPDDKLPQSEDAKKSGARDNAGFGAISAAVKQILALPTKAKAGGAVAVVSGAAALQQAMTDYTQERESCLKAQPQAAWFCREETSPNLQSILQNVNMIAAGANAIAVKDSCSDMAKAMNVVQTGLTLYTGICGGLKLRCDMVCGSAQKSLAALQAAAAQPVSCAATNAAGSATCGAVALAHTNAMTQLKGGLAKEEEPTKPGTIGGNVKVCSGEYGKLLLSAGLSMASVAKSMIGAKNCKNQSDGSGSGTSQASAGSSASATVTSAGTASSSASSALTTTAGTATVTPVMGAGPIISSTPAASSVSDAATNRAPAAAAKTKEQLEAENPYRAYLPGGTKAAISEEEKNKMSGLANWQKEVTPAHGRTNFNKMQDAYKSQSETLLGY